MESSDDRHLVGNRKSLSVDPLLMRGDYVTRRPTDSERKSRPIGAKTGSRRRRSRDDDALPVIISRRRRSETVSGSGDCDDETTSLRSCYVYWPPSRSLSTGDFTAAATALNSRYDSADRLSDVVGCRLPRTKDSKALKNLLILGGSVMCWLTAFSSIQSLQSTLNHRRTLGVASLAALYSVLFLVGSVVGGSVPSSVPSGSVLGCDHLMLLRSVRHPATLHQVDNRRRLRRPPLLRRRKLRLDRVPARPRSPGCRGPHGATLERPVDLPHHPGPR